jgi:hypothetical protein
MTMALCAAAGAATIVPKKTAFEIKYPNASPLAKYIGSQADAALDSIASHDPDIDIWNAAEAKTDAAMALAVAYGGDRDLDAFREADYARRLLSEMELWDPTSRQDLVKYLRAHDELGRLLAFGLRSNENGSAVFSLMDRLRHERPRQVEALPNLAVALCLVRDRPLHEHINENTTTAADPLDVFDFYVAHENQMLYGIRGMPVELLVYVVDTTATIDEMNWALRKYAGTADVGHLFFTITYDYEYLEGKAPKKLDVAGFSLQNILKVGGVCVDQAYFATTVGKAIGVPTAIAGAASAEAGHAWVGYLAVRGRTAAWDFDSGRYAAYKGVRGNVTDPQSGRGIADSTVSMLGDMIGTTVEQRQTAVAMTDAARILLGPSGQADTGESARYRNSHLMDADATLGQNDFVVPEVPDALPKNVIAKLPKPRVTSAATGLELIEMGLKQYASYPPAWDLIATLATKDELSDAQKKTWADLVQRLCGQRHPDFALAVLDPMIANVKDPNTQSAMWDTVFAMMKNRADLAAQVRLQQAALWRDRGNLARAGQCYEDVINRYINAGPFALTAVEGAESVLRAMGQPAKVLDLYANAFRMVTKPGLSMSSEFIKQSNWYKLREAYAKKLEEAGQTQMAEAIRSDVGQSAAGKH